MKKLANREVETQHNDFRIDIPIDKDAITKKMGSEKMFMTMLSRFEKVTLEPSLRSLAECLDMKDIDEVSRAQSFKSKCHQLNGAVSYVGAGVIYYATL